MPKNEILYLHILITAITIGFAKADMIEDEAWFAFQQVLTWESRPWLPSDSYIKSIGQTEGFKRYPKDPDKAKEFAEMTYPLIINHLTEDGYHIH